MRARIRCLSLSLAVGLAFLPAQDKPEYTFGTTVVDPGGFQGDVFHLKSGTQKLPNLRRMEPVGTIYTRSLNVWPQQFEAGFPDITDRYEWFAIAYSGRLWIENAGVYRFGLLSDDGARLRLNGRTIIDMDGQHSATASSAGAMLARGVYEIEIEYFQGPRFTVALVLSVSRPGEGWRILNLGEFKPPQDPNDWVTGKVSDVRAQTL